MSYKTVPMTDGLYEYVLQNWLKEPQLLADLRDETARMPEGGMQISPDQGQLMGVLTKLIGAKRALEIGTFTGYSAISVASALPDDGLLVCLDVSEEFTAVAQRYWKKAGLENKIQLVVGPAAESLQNLIEDEDQADYDMAFLDADKPNYPVYFEACLQLVKSGGMILIDNVFRGGNVGVPDNHEEATEVARSFNAKVYQDDRVEIAVIPIADGLTICRVK